MAGKELTREYFDKSLKDLRFGMTKEIKDHVTKEITREIDKLAVMTAKGFADLEKRLDVREDVEKLKRDNHIIKAALHIS